MQSQSSEIYSYKTKTFFKNGQQVGPTELYAPKVYGGAFLGLVVGGLMISGDIKNGEFVSGEHYNFGMTAPTAEALLSSQVPGRYNRQNKNNNAHDDITCQIRGYATPRDACIGENQVDPTEVRRVSFESQGSTVKRISTHMGYLDQQGRIVPNSHVRD